MIFYSFYWAKTAFVSLLMISITFEATCSGPVSALFNSLIVGITSANEGEHSAASNSNQRPLELKLADAQMLQQWIGQIARKIVVEDGIFAGNYLCCPNININAVILTDGLPKERIKKIGKNLLKDFKEVQNLEQKSQFLKLLFSFGAMLSAEIGEQSQQNGTLRALLKAYECVGKQFNGISNFVIQAVIKRSYDELKVDKIILESQSIDKLNHRLIQEFGLLNALNIQMTPKDIINFASFIYGNFLNYPTNPFEKSFLKDNGLSVYTLDKDPVKSRRIALKLLIHLKNWGLNELEEFSKEYFKDNLLQRMAKFELLDDYFGELNIGDLVNYAKDQMKYFERLSAENCYENRRKEWGEGNESKQQNKPKKENEGIENSKIYPFLDEAIRIDWNVWKEIIQQIDQLSETINQFYVPPKNAEGGLKHFLEVNVEAQLFELFFSFAARLEAIVHGKNIDGTIKKSPENSKDKIRAFLAVPNCFNVPEWPNKFSIFDYWMEIKDFNPKKSQIPVIGVAIPIFWKIDENEEAKSISRGNYKTLKALNEQKFSFYETTKLLRQIYDRIDGHRSSLIYMIIPEIITNPLNQISHIRGCEFVKLFQNVSANFLKMEDVTLDTEDSNLQDYVEQDFEKFCKILERMDSRVEEAKIAFLNYVRYDLVIDFTSNAWKYVHDITKDLLGKWTKEKLTEETTFAEGNEKYMLEQFKEFTTETNRKKISKIEALKAKEKDGYDLLGLFDRLDVLARKVIDEEMPNLEKAKKELINVKGKKQKKETEEEIKRIMKLVESAREMGKRLGQMLEDVKKHYGQAMDE
uniref:Uncharacterized protein n=1 Tax=Globodera rostochiensis TaxID=31243 RepID=A0A914IBA5_GLORO